MQKTKVCACALCAPREKRTFTTGTSSSDSSSDEDESSDELSFAGCVLLGKKGGAVL
jgi:hypothetical protein